MPSPTGLLLSRIHPIQQVIKIVSKPRHFTCKKCGIEPHKWERTPEEEMSDYKCPRCGKNHYHLKTETANELIPIDQEDKEAQNVFVTVTGRKIRGIETAKKYLTDEKTKSCRRCGKKKSENWKYSPKEGYDLICPNCEQRHLEDTKCLIPVDRTGNRLDVMTDADGNTYIGEEEIREAIQKMSDSTNQENYTTGEEDATAT